MHIHMYIIYYVANNISFVDIVRKSVLLSVCSMRVGLIVKKLEGLFSRENSTECSQIYDILSRFPYQN